MSIKDLFNNTGSPKIQKSVTSDELVETVESSDYIEAKKTEHEQFVPPIDFSDPSNFAKFGSAELYYEKSFERIHNYYPYDGTLSEKLEFENSSSYLDKYVFDNLYPRTNGYVNFDGNQKIEIFGGPHTASAGMEGKPLEDTFDSSMVYDADKRRDVSFEYRADYGCTIEFWLKKTHPATTARDRIVDMTNGETLTVFQLDYRSTLTQNRFQLSITSGSIATNRKNLIDDTAVDGDWHHYAFTIYNENSETFMEAYKDGTFIEREATGKEILDIIPVSSGMQMAIGSSLSGPGANLTAHMDEFRFWKTKRTPEQIYNTWFTQVGGGTNKNDANLDLGLYLKFNEGISGNDSLDSLVLDYSGRISNGVVDGYTSSFRSTGSAITEALGQPEFLDPIIYSSHPDVVSKKAEYKTSGSLADIESTSQIISYFPGWMQEEDELQGKQLKYLSQVIGSYFDTLWHQINFIDKIHDNHYISGSNTALPFSKKLLQDKGFVIPDMFIDASITENLLNRDDNEVYEKEINEVRNTIYHNLYNNLETIYKSKGTEKSFRNFFRSIGIGQDLVKLNMYADDSTFIIRDNYQYKSLEKNFVNFNREGHFDATLFQSSSNGDYYIPGDKDYLGSFTFETEIILPKKQRKNEIGYFSFPDLTSSIGGFHSTGSAFDYPTSNDLGMSLYVLKNEEEKNLNDDESQTVRFMVTGAFGELTSSEISYQYDNNKWNLALRMRHSTYPYGNITGSIEDDFTIDFYGVESEGDIKRNSFYVSASNITADYFRSDKIFYAGAERVNYSGSVEYNTDMRLGSVRYWHSYLSNEAIDQHSYDPETFGSNNPEQSDLVDTYPVEIPREKTLALHWGFDTLTGSDSSGEFLVPDLSSGSNSPTLYGSLATTLGQMNEAKGIEFNTSDTKAIDKDYLHVARKRLLDNLMSSDLTTIKSDETEQFFVDEDVSDNFYSFEKSMYATISDEMMNLFSTAIDLNNLIGQPNQRYHHDYNMMSFLRDRFYDDVENEPDLEKFTSFYKWIDDSISIALQQLIPASARFSEKINNVVESHVLERNKYTHQLPILTTFESTEGSIKGISEMKYDWKHGHAPTYPEEEQHNVLWQTERKEKDGLRETLRQSRNNHSLQSSGLVRREIDGSTRISDTYAVRRFAKTYDVSLVTQPTIHGGTNFSRNKNVFLFRDNIALGGEENGSAEPINIITAGLEEGLGVVDQVRNEDNLPRKKKVELSVHVKKRNDEEYGKFIKSNYILPMNVMSGTVHTGYNKTVKELFTSEYIFSNLHHDITSLTNDTPIQGPFTEAHVGGLQYRHIDINKYDISKSNTVTVSTLPTPPTGTIEFDISVLETKYNEGTGSWVRVRDADGSRETFNYAPFYDFVDGEWSTMDQLSYLISHKLDVQTNQQTPSILELTQSTSGSFYNEVITTDSNNFITASGFAGGGAPIDVTVNRYIDVQGERPEGWALLFKQHIKESDTDGAFGFVGADYGTPYPYPHYPLATRYRDEHAKRPINVRNIKTNSESQKAGNYKNEVELFSVASEHQKSWAKRAYDDPNVDILPQSLTASLPETTHYQTLVTRYPSEVGNIFGTIVNNRQVTGIDQPPSFALNVEENEDDPDYELATTTVTGYSTIGDKSFSFWINLDNANTIARYVFSSTSSTNADSIRIWFQSNQIFFSTSTGAGVKTFKWNVTTSDFVSTWKHVVIVWDGDQTSNPNLYIDNADEGGPDSTAGSAGGTTIVAMDKLYLFDYRSNHENHELQGSLQNFGIYDVSLSASDVADIYNSGVTLDTPEDTSDLLDFWYLGNDISGVSVGTVITSGQIVSSSYGNLNHLTSSGGVTVVSGNPTPTLGGSSPISPDFYNIILSPTNESGKSSERNINTRFSAPGGVEVQTLSYLDAYSQTYSVHNAMPFRNLSVLGSGSGEDGTIRVEDHLGLRRGLKTLRALHMGQFGIDPDYGTITSADYPSSASFGKQHRNTSNRMEWNGSSDVGLSGVELITGSAFDNMHINSPIPRSELQYSWIHNATSGSDALEQHILGYAPRDGIVSSSAGFVEAIVFPSASSIFAR
jgi:hypothetical protein